jgi:FtsP/CotA-like multicopper oxidase with cupredoxin domain
MPASSSVRLIAAKVKGAPGGFERVIGLLQSTGVVQKPADAQQTAVIGAGPLPPAIDVDQLPVFDETTYGEPRSDPVATGPFDVTAPVILNPHPGFHNGALQLTHTINGQASPYVAPITVREGQLVHLHIVNANGEYHPVHVHGHVFSVISTNGVPVQGSPLHLDSVLVGPFETVDVAFLADNSGIWMFHCHVLIHAPFGMSTTINYAGISTPYEMDSRSGNIPE